MTTDKYGSPIWLPFLWPWLRIQSLPQGYYKDRLMVAWRTALRDAFRREERP